MRIPGLILGSRDDYQCRSGPASGQIEKIGLKNRSLKGAVILADGGYHEFPPGKLVLNFVE